MAAAGRPAYKGSAAYTAIRLLRAAMDKYRNYKELEASETEGIDYDVVVICREKSRFAVIAPHGGKIEPMTAELAKAIAGNEFNLYCFRGIKKSNNRDLHITSHNFDEPRCLSLLESQTMVVAIHGCDKQGERVLLGGRDTKLMAELAAALDGAGVRAETSGHEFAGRHPRNICNRGSTGTGVQFELSMSFRQGPNTAKFVEAIRDALRSRENKA